jgi:hypothetical protein
VKDILIKVTAEDIAESRRRLQGPTPCRSLDCPVAVAAQRIFVRHGTIRAGLIGVSASALHLWHCDDVPLPLVAIQFICAFDHGKPVEPFEFTISVPDEIPTQEVASS